MPSLRLDGRRALVTGGGRGLGFACASALAAAGAEVLLVARSPDEVESASSAIRSTGANAEGAVLDVTDINAVSTWVAAQKCFDILVNNAGTNRPAEFAAVSPRDYDEVFSLNVRAAFFTAQAVARRLIEEDRPGSVINMSSQMGHIGAARRTVYCATKHALEGLTKAMAAELGHHHIRVNTICPTFIETALTQFSLEDEAVRTWALGRIKVGRVGQPQDVMGAVVFLASDASALMTGSALVLDGGWTTTS
jgi:NAD(P)-dependent dehydrogenase (short-subunit alcohol dehydrogenase family)